MWGAGLLGYKAFLDFVKNVEEMSGGRLIIKPFSAGGLVGCFKVFDAVRAGAFEGFKSACTYWVGKDPAFSPLLGMPLSFRESWQLEAWFWEGGGIDLAREHYAKWGLYYVGPVHFGADSMHFKSKPEDIGWFKGKKFRTPHGMAADFIAALGAHVVVMPGGEVYTALAKGLLDGAEFITLDGNFGLGFHEVAKYFMMTGLHAPAQTSAFVVRMDKWEALSPDLQRILETAVRELSAETWLGWAVANYEARKKMLARGNVEVFFGEECWAKALETAKGIWAEWKEKNPMIRRIIESKLEFKRHLGVIP